MNEVEGGVLGELSDESVLSKQMGRREVLKRLMRAGLLMAAATGVGVDVAWLVWTDPDSDRSVDIIQAPGLAAKKSEAATAADVAPVILEGISSDLNPESRNVGEFGQMAEDLIAGLNHIGTLRNYGVNKPEMAREVAGQLHRYNNESDLGWMDEARRQQGWSPDLIRANQLNTLKYEAYIALRYLQDQGLVVDEGLDRFNFSGTISYIVHPDNFTVYPLGRQFDYRRDIVNPMDFQVEPENDTLEHTDALVRQHWRTIKEVSTEYVVDPMFVAALISMEARDQEFFYLYTDGTPGGGFDELTLSEMVLGEVDNDIMRNKLLAVLTAIEKQPELAAKILPDRVSEDVIDLLGGIAGQNNSIGLGQIRPENAEKLDFLQVLGRDPNDKFPEALWAILLTNPQINIMATAATVRQLIDEYNEMQRAGLNLYLPNLSVYNPGINNSLNKLKGDPLYGENFGIAAFGQWYNDGPYNPQVKQESNLVNERDLRVIGTIFDWGSGVASYFRYYHEEKERLGLD